MAEKQRERSIYKSREGRHIVAAWCEEQLERLEGAERREIPTSLGPTHVVTLGAGRDVLFMAGMNSCSASSLRVLSLLATSYRVHGLDIPGQPGLSAPVRPKSPSSYSIWLGEACTALGIEEPLIVGHSLGALAALTAAAGATPVAGIVLAAPAGIMRLSVPPRTLAPSSRWLARPTLRNSRRLLEVMTAPRFRPSERLVEWMYVVARHARPSLTPKPLPAWTLRAVRVPGVVVCGRHDPFVPPGRAGRLVDALPTARVVIKECGHLIPEEDPGALLEALGTLPGA